jgi:hypothetical protein
MKYRAISCNKCGKVESLGLNSKEICECGGTFYHGWQVEDKMDGTPYTCFIIEKTVKELFSEKC